MKRLLNILTKKDIAVLYKKFRTTENYELVKFRGPKSEVVIYLPYGISTEVEALEFSIAILIQNQIEGANSVHTVNPFGKTL